MGSYAVLHQFWVEGCKQFNLILFCQPFVYCGHKAVGECHSAERQGANHASNLLVWGGVGDYVLLHDRGQEHTAAEINVMGDV